MEGPLEWAASIGTMLAAAIIALDLGRRMTAWGFVLFCVVSLMWVYSGFTGGAIPIAAMNIVLFVINAWGVKQYWSDRKRPNARAKGEPNQSAK